MAGYADGAVLRSNHHVARMLDSVVGVADDTAREAYAGKRILVRAGVEKLLLKNMAGGAYMLD